MGAGLLGIDGERVGGLAYTDLAEPEVLVDAGEAGAPRGAVGIEQQPPA